MFTNYQTLNNHRLSVGHYFFNSHLRICSLRQEGRQRERERDINWLPSKCTPIRDKTHNLGMCPCDRILKSYKNSWANGIGNWDKKIKQGQTIWTTSQLVNHKTLSPLTKVNWEQIPLLSSQRIHSLNHPRQRERTETRFVLAKSKDRCHLCQLNPKTDEVRRINNKKHLRARQTQDEWKTDQRITLTLTPICSFWCIRILKSHLESWWTFCWNPLLRLLPMGWGAEGGRERQRTFRAKTLCWLALEFTRVPLVMNFLLPPWL